MISCLCVIQEQQGPDKNRQSLANAINTYSQQFLGDKAEINRCSTTFGARRIL